MHIPSLTLQGVKDVTVIGNFSLHSAGQHPAWTIPSSGAGLQLGVPGSGRRDKVPPLVPIPASGLLTMVWADVTASDMQGAARSLFPPLSESQGHRPRSLQLCMSSKRFC